MTNEEKAATLLLSLEEEVAAKVMKNLGADEIRRVGRCMNNLSGISDKDIGDAAGEFCRLAQEKGKKIVSIQDDAVENIIVKALGEEKGKEFIKTIEDDSFSHSSSIIEKLRNTDSEALINLTRLEHPQTTALILAHLRSEQVAEVLEALPPDSQKDIVWRIATLGSIPHEFMEEMTKTLGAEMIVGRDSEEQVGGVRIIAEIMNKMSQSSEEAILESLEEANPDMVNEIKGLMFTFDDILGLDDMGMRMLLGGISREDLARALKIVSDEMKEKVFKNISKRAAEMLKEDMADMPPTKLSDVEKSQQMIIDAAKQLESEGKLVLAGSGKGDVFV